MGWHGFGGHIGGLFGFGRVATGHPPLARPPRDPGEQMRHTAEASLSLALALGQRGRALHYSPGTIRRGSENQIRARSGSRIGCRSGERTVGLGMRALVSVMLCES